LGAPRATFGATQRPKRSQERLKGLREVPGRASRRPLEAPKTTKNAVLLTNFEFSAERNFEAAQIAP